MLRRRWLVILALSLGLLLAATVPAAPPDDVSVQGKLVDSSGEPLGGPVALRVRIYEAPSGGESVYGEEHLAVDLVNGVFHVLLGTGTAREGTLDASAFSSQNTYLEVDVDDETLEPRLPFSSVAYSLQSDVSQVALFAESAADSETVDGQTPAQIRTTSFATITDVIAETQVPASIARSADLAAETQARSNALDSANATIAGLEVRISALEADLATRGAQIAELLQRFSGVGRNGDTLSFVAMNVQIRNGAGATNFSNGMGNLILGYNENGAEQRVRTGSHNVVVGREHTYTSYAGVVAGRENTISGPYATVTAGEENTASGTLSSVTGGEQNTASGSYSSVSAGLRNEASGSYAAVVGGGGTHALFDPNHAYADYSVVVGGVGNTTGKPSSSDRAVGQSSTIGGGGRNRTEGYGSSVAGGGTVATGTGNTASGFYAAILGGQGNEASGTSSTVSGGRNNDASGFYSGVGGGEYNEASGRSSSVAGGGSSVASEGNHAFADYSAILGGWKNKTGDISLVDHSLGMQSTVSGGANNRSIGRVSSSLGGTNNQALEIRSVTVGGGNNKASKDLSTVIGGLGIDGDEANGTWVGPIPGELSVEVLRVEGAL